MKIYISDFGLKLAGSIAGISIVIIVFIIFFVPFLSPFTPRGEITGEFMEGYHEGFGDFCGDYPNSGIRLRNATYNKEHFWGERNWFYFGNQYKGIDEMIKNQKYRIWYHQESRLSDTTSGASIEYFVIDGIKPLT